MNNDVLAVVAGKEITEADFDAFKVRLPQEQQAYLQNPEAVAYFKEQFVAVYLFAELGKEEKINETKEFKETVAQIELDVLSQMAMHKVLSEIEVTDEEAKAYYNAHQASYMKQDSAHAKHILMESEEEIKKVQSEIENGTMTFEEAAAKHSTCPSSQQGGDLGEFSRGQMVPEFEEAAFAAEPGKMAGPVKTQFGYHLIKVENRSNAAVASFEEVKNDVKNILLQQKQQGVYTAKVAELKAKYCK